MDRFWNKTQPEDSGCIRWIGGMSGSGYGNFWLDGRQWPAHRAAYALFVGDPVGHDVDHTCENTWCVNPDHLQLVTHAENIYLHFKRRGIEESCQRGHRRTPNNTYVLPKGRIACRACARLLRTEN